MTRVLSTSHCGLIVKVTHDVNDPFYLFATTPKARKAQTCHTRLTPLRYLRQLRVGQLHGGQSPHAFAELAVDLCINIINGIISLGLLLRLRLIGHNAAVVFLLRQRSYLIRTVYETRDWRKMSLCEKPSFGLCLSTVFFFGVVTWQLLVYFFNFHDKFCTVIIHGDGIDCNCRLAN